ncbi:right-handed parallel beta-helix repeat-containing protein [Membranihabitans marinus]|uniref:right-handed parallel beta-helix repeat-containing protein n=1 Tax=Membranihabitans marinus TaxID=1227546 RepID=UPI001F2362D1|nr:right-handed parallel beta-helix repeat-containing protein [Membranihabitans marinus]
MTYFKLSIFLLFFLFLQKGYGQPPGETMVNPHAVATYECAGLYWKTMESGPCTVRYRAVGSEIWQDGLDLVYDEREGEYRGSIINLKPYTKYEAELSHRSENTKMEFTTRNDDFSIGKTTVIPAGESDQTITITESGRPDAYHLVTVPAETRSVLNIKNVYDAGIIIDADYVIVRGIEVRNARKDGIRIKKGHHNIVIEDCYITFWGRIGGSITNGNMEGNYDSGIYAENDCWNLTIQRNLIEEPRGASNDWETGHPAGPQGISIFQSLGGNVIRYNDIVSTEDHGFNDGIGGGSNYSTVGNMNRDSDIYGNLIRSVWDDAIEVEGSNKNVRVFGNYAEKFFNGVATASTTHGPIYIFRNVMGESRTGQRNTMGGAFVKTGEREPYNGGRRYVFHNTILQPNGVKDAFTGHVNPNCVTRNNIFDLPGRLATHREKEPASDYDYDYFSGLSKGTAEEEHGIEFYTTPAGTRLYVSSTGLEFYPRLYINSIAWGKYPYEFGDKKRNITDPMIQLKNPLIDGGIVLKGFNDDYRGDGPDLGAFETGERALEFGRRAYLSYDEGWCPWEKY